MQESVSKLVAVLSPETALTTGAEKAVGSAVGSLLKYVRFKLDPWGQLEHKKALVDTVRSAQVSFLEDALEKMNQSRLNALGDSPTEDILLHETLRYLNSPVFIKFLEGIDRPPKYWKGGKAKNANEFYEPEAWWDRFCELINKRHEPWRASLLAEALKVETMELGHVSYTTLWKIATLPPHSWLDLTDFKSLASELWVNGEYRMSVIPGTHSKISQTEYETGRDSTRLISELEVSLMEDQLTSEAANVFVLSKHDDNTLRVGERSFEIKVMDGYVDPMHDDETDEDVEFRENYFRFFGLGLSYIGDELIQLATHSTPHVTRDALLATCAQELREDGVELIPSP